MILDILLQPFRVTKVHNIFFYTYLLIVGWGLGCNTHTSENTSNDEVITDCTSSVIIHEVLRNLDNTVDNFLQLNKKKYENQKAYHEFADLVTMQLNKFIELTKDLDCYPKHEKYIHDIHNNLTVLKGNNLEKSKQASLEIGKIFREWKKEFSIF